jgi:hypothetical protein
MRREFLDVQDEMRIDPMGEVSGPEKAKPAAAPKPTEKIAEKTTAADPKPEPSSQKPAGAADSLDASGDKAAETAGG